MCQRDIPGAFTFDSYLTNAENLNHIHSKQDQFDRPRGYGGELKFDRKIGYKGKQLKAEALAASIP